MFTPIYLANETVARAVFQHARCIAFDLETTGLDPYLDRILVITFAWHDGYQYRTAYTTDIRTVQFLFTDPTYRKIAHHAKFDCKFVYHAIGAYPTLVDCTMIREQVLFAGLLEHVFGLEDCVQRRFGVTLDKSIRLGFIGRDCDDVTDVELQYALTDAYYTLRLYEIQEPELDAKELRHVYDLEAALIPIVAHMEYEGIAIDRERLEAAIPHAYHMLHRVQFDIQRIAIVSGFSSKIVLDADGFYALRPSDTVRLLQYCGVHVQNLDRRHLIEWDTINDDTDFPEELQPNEQGTHAFTHPLLRLIDAEKALSKLIGTYYEGLRDRIHPRTHRIHPQFHQCGATATGRFSSTDPNFQNLPNMDKLQALQLQDYDVRSLFIAAPDYTFIIADYSGIELAILAALSNDPTLIEQITNGDIHTFVAMSLFGDAIVQRLGEPMTSANAKKGLYKVIRDQFKRVSYATCYGSTGYNIFRVCGPVFHTIHMPITKEIADTWVHRWKFELFPQTGAFFERMAKSATTQYETSSVYGRKRFWSPERVRSSTRAFHAAEREGMNQPIQSSSADMMKHAMVRIHRFITEHTIPARIVATIHDEVVIEVHRQEADRFADVVKTCMEQAACDLFPNAPRALFKVEPKISPRYDK